MPPIIDAAIIADVEAKINAEFPTPGGLLPSEAAQFPAARHKLAICIAEAGIYVRDNALVVVPGVTAGGDTVDGTLE